MTNLVIGYDFPGMNLVIFDLNKTNLNYPSNATPQVHIFCWLWIKFKQFGLHLIVIGIFW